MRRQKRYGVALALSLAGLAAWADPPALSPGAQKAVDAWKAQYEAAEAMAAARPKSTPIEELRARVDLEQAARNALSVLQDPALSRKDLDEANRTISPIISAHDAENTAFLKTILPADGWFRISRDGRQASIDAWLIAQHSPDQQFMRDTLAKLEPLVKIGDVEGQHYALMFDRVSMSDGKLQTYGSQGICKDGKIVIAPIQDPDHVDERRQAIGLPPMAEYEKRLGVGRRC